MAEAAQKYETPPYRDTLQAIRAALNVDARCLYKPSSWQQYAGSGYRESAPRAEMTKLEAFQQACMTAAFLHSRLPPVEWAALVVAHAPALSRKGRRVASDAEIQRMVVAVLLLAGEMEYPGKGFARWAVAHWGGRLPMEASGWSFWVGRDVAAVRTLQRHYAQQIRPWLADVERRAMRSADLALWSERLIEVAELSR